jgi:hypothetical protein
MQPDIKLAPQQDATQTANPVANAKKKALPGDADDGAGQGGAAKTG